jgi:prepilin-type N-terminal cleavage/methylation domain-containing protein
MSIFINTIHHYKLKQTGFTLLELLLVMAIIAAAVALIAPRLGDNALTQLKVETREMVALLNYARRMAIIQGEVGEVRLYAPQKNKKNVKPTKYQSGRWVSRGASLHSADALNKDSKDAIYVVKFYPGGGSSGGEWVLKRKRFSAKVIVNPITGKVKVDFPE